MDDFEYQLRAEKEYGEGSHPTEDSKSRTYVDANDGVVYEWDANRGGWFPKIDEEFLAAYQAGYGVGEPDSDAATVTQPTSAKDTTAAALTREEESLNEDGKKDHTATSVGSEKDLGRKRKVSEEAGWFDIDSDHNHNVYVSGLPLDITVEEFVKLMGKCGIITEDENGEPKVKLYEDVNGELKGDGLCCYLKIESVELALQLLDQSTHREHTITVQQAKFQMKGDYNPALKKKKKKTKKSKKKGGQEKLLDWRERNVEGPKRLKSERVVIFKHLFNPKEFEDDPMAINDIRDDLRQECEKFGVVKKILIFDRHPDGLGSVAFQDFPSADQCVQKLHGRWFGGQQLEVGYWDGVTNYQVEETDQEREQRLSKWENFLNEGNSGEGKITVVERGVGEGERQGAQDEVPTFF